LRSASKIPPRRTKGCVGGPPDRMPTRQRTCRGGFQTRPPSAHTAREIFSWVIHPPNDLFAIAPCEGGFEIRPTCSIGAQPRGPRLLRQGGLETRPDMNLDPCATSRSCSLHCTWSKLALCVGSSGHQPQNVSAQRRRYGSAFPHLVRLTPFSYFCTC
jgi:hypothetical protein